MKFFCLACSQQIYKFEGQLSPNMLIDSGDFKSIRADIPNPINEQEANCPLCGANLKFIDEAFKE